MTVMLPVLKIVSEIMRNARSYGVNIDNPSFF